MFLDVTDKAEAQEALKQKENEPEDLPAGRRVTAAAGKVCRASPVNPYGQKIHNEDPV